MTDPQSQRQNGGDGMLKLRRSVSRRENTIPSAFNVGSAAQAVFCIDDARHDILCFSDALRDARLRISALEAEREKYDTPAWQANERLNAQVEQLCAERDRLRAALAMRPMSEAPKIDGRRILAWQKSRWGFPAYWRVIYWNEGIGRAGYTFPCWMCAVCILSEKEEDFAGWVSLPPDPAREALGDE
jgi:hypothetical protein